MMRKGCTLLILFTLLSVVSTAQQYPFVYYTPKDGLVNSRVRKLYQDSKGRLYFMTFGGLSVYDGARFRNYTIQDGLAVDMVNDIIEVGDDSLLVSTNLTQLNVLVNGVIRKFESDNKFYPIINNFLKSSDGYIYATADEGLFRINGHRFEQIKFPMARPEVPPFLAGIVEYKGKFIISTNDLRGFKGLYLVERKTGKLLDMLPDPAIATFAKDKSGRIWISIADSLGTLDLKALDTGHLVIKSVPNAYKQIARLPTSSISFDNGYVWLINYRSELIRVGEDGSQLLLTPNLKGQGDLGRIFIDREGITWISSAGAGALKLANTTLQLIDPQKKNDETETIYNAYYSNDTTWCLVNPNKITRYVNDIPQEFTSNLQARKYSLMQSNGELYATTAQQLYYAPAPSSGSRSIQFRLLQTLIDTNFFRGLQVRDPYGNMIVGQKDSVAVFKNRQFIGQFVIGKYDLIEGMKFDHSKRLWLTTRQAISVFTLHPEDPAHYLKLLHHFRKEFATVSPRSMAMDKNDIVWVGTRSNGLYAYQLENDQLKEILHLQRKHGLTDEFITALAVDSSNNILAGTQTGLDRIILNENWQYRIENITKRSNVFGYVLQIWVDNKDRAHVILSNGSMLQIAPVLPSQSGFEPQLFIEDIKVNGYAFRSNKNNPVFPYGQRNLSFNIAAPAFVDERQIKYSYLLQGSGNNQWSEPSSNAELNFLNLSPGKYTLEVRASFPSTDYPDKFISYTFTIVPPWWQTWWFAILAAALLVFAAVLAIRFYYRRKLEKQKTLLERQQAVEKERTRIATDMHDDLGAGLSRIKFLSETIGIKKQQQQPIEEDIGKIREYSHDMIDKMGEIVWALNQKNDSLSDLLSYTRAYAAEYLAQNGIECTIDAPELFTGKFVSGEFRRNIYLTVKEALHNIVKHSQASKVSIQIKTGRDLSIIIHDNGIGFDETKTRPFSNGLFNMKKRMESLGGKLLLKNTEGTTVSLVVDLP